MTADARMVAAWTMGWTLARETPPPVPDHGGLRVDVGWPRQKARYVFSELSPGIGQVASAIREPWVFVKACATAEAMQPALPPGWVIQPPGYMMARAALSPADPVLPAGYRLHITRGPVSVVRVAGPGAEEAAIGRVVVVDGFAIHDRIETQPEHRRRGLARAVMAALGAIAREGGAARGVLVATPVGRSLYESLGWELHAPYTTAVIPGS